MEPGFPARALNRLPQKLRLLALTPIFPPGVGGASEDFRILSGAWSQRRTLERLVILTEHCPGHPRTERQGKVEVFRLLPARDTRPELGWFSRRLRSAMTCLALPLLVAWQCRRNRIRVIVIHGRYARRWLLKLLRRLSLEAVVFLSDRHASPEAMAEARAVVCNSEAVFKRAAGALQAGAAVHYAPVPLELPVQNLPSSLPRFWHPYLLFAGEVSAQKGADVLLQAFAVFREQHPEYRLFLAGPLRDRSLTSRPHDSAVFLGAVARPLLLSLMRGAEALVLPSRSESLPRVCLEAMALGTRVVLPPGVPEFERALPGWTLKAITVSDLLEALRHVAQSSEIPEFDFSRHDARLVAKQILAICIAASRPDVRR